MSSITAICYDHSGLITGTLSEVHDWGCELVAFNANPTSPEFPRKSWARLNLFDEQSGRSHEIQVRLTGVCRRDGAWTYRIRWAGVPEILRLRSGSRCA